MNDPWLDQLSDYLDGGLAPADDRALEAHLETCDVCRATLAELRRVVSAAHAIADIPPANDLWAGIAAGIAAGSAPAPRQTAPDAAVLPLRRPDAQPRRPHMQRRFSFSTPQLAAAAVLLLSLGAGAVWLLGGGTPGFTPARTAGGDAVSGTILVSSYVPDENTRPVAVPAETGARYDADLAELEETLAGMRDQLDPHTVEVIERSLESIDDALDAARAALAADPGNPHLHRQLDGAMQKKLDVLRRASGVRRGAT